MEHPLDDSYLKVERANEQLESLHAEMQKIREANALEIDFGFNKKTGEHMVRIPEVPSWPARWGVLVGEVAHNLRSALDYIIFQLASNPEEQRTAFPISLSERDYFRPRGKRKISYRDHCLAGVDPTWAAKVDELQPFKLDSKKHGIGPLGVLNWLSNREKHRIRLPVLSRIETPFAFVTVEKPDRIRNIELRMSADGEDRSCEAQLRHPGGGRKAKHLVLELDHKDPDGVSGIQVAFGTRGIAMPQLVGLVQAVDIILGKFKPAFDPAPGSN